MVKWERERLKLHSDSVIEPSEAHGAFAASQVCQACRELPSEMDCLSLVPWGCTAGLVLAA